jgi:hypothetical protein
MGNPSGLSTKTNKTFATLPAKSEMEEKNHASFGKANTLFYLPITFTVKTHRENKP